MSRYQKKIIGPSNRRPQGAEAMKNEKDVPVAHVSREIADAFGMEGLPNTVVHEAEHTPTPWNQEGRAITCERWSTIATVDNGATDMDENVITEDEADANAAFIVRAVNAHEELLTALKKSAAILDVLVNSDLSADDYKDAERYLLLAQQAIANAEGKS